MMTTRTTVGAFALAFTLVAAACGSDDDTATPATDTSEAMADSMGDMDGMEGMAMNMGDPNATRADDVDGAALATGEFVLLDTRPEGFDGTTGSGWIARHPDGTTVTIELAGLLPDADYISHLHNDVCANNGGDHYQFEVGGSELPPNEIHLAFTSSADGTGFMTAENHQIAGLDAVALVVHPADLVDNKIACVDFVELEAGAAAAMLEMHRGMDAMEMDDHDDMEMDEMEMDEMEMDETNANS